METCSTSSFSISQAYVQSDTSVRQLFFQVPTFFGLSSNSALRVNCALSGLLNQRDNDWPVLLVVCPKPDYKTSFISKFTRFVYTAASFRPFIALGFWVRSQYSRFGVTLTKHLNKFISKAKQKNCMSLKFVMLHHHTFKTFMFTNATFAFHLDLLSQFCYIVALRDRGVSADILHYS